MAEEKKRQVTIKINDLPEELSDEALEQVTGGVLQDLAQTGKLSGKLSKISATAIAPNIGQQASDYCDCWSYTACAGNLGGIYQR